MAMPKIAFGQQRFEEELAALQTLSQKHIVPLEIDHVEAGTIKIFSLWPKPIELSLGGCGTFRIPGCPANRLYSEPLEVWRRFPEARATDSVNKLQMVEMDGYLVAESIVGIGQGFSAATSLARQGVFICGAEITLEFEDKHFETMLHSRWHVLRKQMRMGGAKLPKEVSARKVTEMAIEAARKHGDERTKQEIADDILACSLPTEAELTEAAAKMNGYRLELVELANSSHQAGAPEQIQPIQRDAARLTGNDSLPWVQMTNLITKCDACGSDIKPGAIICLGCRSVLDEAKVIAKRLPGYEYLWSPSHPDYIPPKAAKSEKVERAAK